MDTIVSIIKKLRENKILSEREDYSKYSRDELISKAQGGDQLAIETLINTHKNFLSKMSHKYIMNSGDKDDIEQLAMIAFWDAINSYDPDSKGDFEAYAGMVIKRKLTDELRKDSAEKRQLNNIAGSLDDTVADDGEGGGLTVGDTVAAADLDPEEEYISREGEMNLIRFMENNLSDTELTVIKKYIAGYKVSAIAEETGMKYKSVENALMRVKNKLAEYIRSSYKESDDMKESADIEFSDEEKQILNSVLSKLEQRKEVRESEINKLKESYENYTEIQLDREMNRIESEIESIVEELRETYDREELFEKLDNMKTKLSAMGYYLSESQIEKSEELRKNISKAVETPVVHTGSDFY